MKLNQHLYLSLLASAVLAGIAFRVYHLFIFGNLEAPVSGGLFIAFAHEIIQNSYRLPATLPYYTSGGIPFSYPPLPFYLEAIAIQVFGVNPVVLSNLFPVAVTILSLPAFHWLTGILGANRWARLAAFAAFTCMPNAYSEPARASGLAESFGLLAMIGYFFVMHQAHTHNRFPDYFKFGLAWALCILASPGSAYSSVLCFLAFAALTLLESKVAGLQKLVYSGLTALLVSSPYWATVIANHGLVVFIHTLTDQYGSSLLAILYQPSSFLLDFIIVPEPYTSIWNFLILLGLLFSFPQKRPLFIAWFLILAILPREGRWLMSIPAALLIGNVIAQIKTEDLQKWDISWPRFSLLVAFVCGWMLLNPGRGALKALTATPGYTPLDVSCLEALAWLKQNTPTDSSIILLPPNARLTDWAPYLAQRTVLNTPNGAEWQPQEALQIDRFNLRGHHCETLTCIGMNSREIFSVDEVILLVSQERLEALNNPNDSRANTTLLLWQGKGCSLLALRLQGK